MRRRRALLPGRWVAALMLVPLVACGGDDPGARRELTVLAAASLTEVFEDLGAEFEDRNPDVDVRFSFGASTTLAEQVVQGAPGDVLATADETAMEVAVDGGATVGDPQPFATNTLVLVVPAANPAGITGVSDLADATWVRCVDDVPCGRVTGAVLDRTRFDGDPASLEVDVKAVLAKVVTGEADAGFVYATDALAAGEDVQVIPVPAAAAEPTTYSAAVLIGGDEAVGDWLALLGSDVGRGLLVAAGFDVPAATDVP